MLCKIGLSGSLLILVTIIVVMIFSTIIALFSRYKKCPSDKILVVYGKVGKNKEGGTRSAKCIHGGAAFIWPIIQDYSFLDLKPISIEVMLQSALSRQNIRVDVPSIFTVAISTEPSTMQNAAERLLGLKQDEIAALAKDIIFGQLRLVIATMEIEEINSDRDKFLSNVTANVEAELKKIGLRLINVNVTDINDESGYIDALGKEAAAKAINDAKKSVAEKNRDGSIGEANAKRDERIKVAEANAAAVEGENNSQITIAMSEAIRREKEAEANKRAIAAEKVQQAKALEEAYHAEEEAEKARANREKATREADVIIPAEIEKRKAQIDADAEAEKIRIKAKGEADAIFARMEAEARGIKEIMTKQAEGFEKIVAAAGGDAQKAVMLMVADKLPELIKTQVEAIKGIKIDKITVWDSMGNGKGTPSTANFLSGMFKSIPPLKDLFNMAGMELPDYLEGEKKENKDENSKTVNEDNAEDSVYKDSDKNLSEKLDEKLEGNLGENQKENDFNNPDFPGLF
ncbi:MAG TPA: flotillin [Ruminiclostridium sp.]|jgi:flotillin|uniref:flotillin family protein n=1 Tax=Acetivibrio saccincola TaxID=1677857 RepID=UPI000EC42D9D|nr:SPFH domain-containing protein [Acetivibrio saccincola]HAA43519.1 flotillin [Ruminiclostridium sp.]HOA97288.1 SPFH domain-containing protein [Acetivibrio saccincola]HQD29782.1 SPFH domain-containing protein [Acetivibrio saccincola]